MSKLFNVFAAILLIVGSCFVVSDSHAKVCFLGEECGSGGNFSGTAPVNLADECIREGYTARSNCEATIGKYIAEYCPFSSNYGTCCSRENKFVSCVYPLQKSGNACGGKYKCVCDKATYKYTAEICAATNARIGGAACSEEVLTSGSNTLTTNTYYSECRCDRGLYPYYTGTDNKSGYGMRCDPNSKEEERGQKCTEYRSDGSSEVFYASCPCNTETYQVTSLSCLPYEADDSSERCFSGGTWYYEQCKSCDAWPAQTLDHVAKTPSQDPILCDGTNEGNCDYEQCPYRVQDRNKADFLIRRCNEPGYRPSTTSDYDSGLKRYLKAGEKCVPVACEVAVKAYLKDYPGTYAIFNGTKLVDADGKTVTPNNQTAIVMKDISVSEGACEKITTKAATYKTVFTDCTCKARSSGTGNQQITHEKACINADDGRCGSGQVYCCTGSTQQLVTSAEYGLAHGGLKCLKIYKLWSGAQLAKIAGGDHAKALNVACAKAPTLTYTSANFPYPGFSGCTNCDLSSSEAERNLVFVNVDLKFSNNTTTDNRTLKFYNNRITVNSSKILTLNGATTFSKGNYHYDDCGGYCAGSDRGEVVLNSSSVMNVKGGLTSNKYEFRDIVTSARGKIKFFTSTYTTADKTVGTITLGNGQQFAVGDLYLTRTDGTIACPPGSCTTSKYATLKIIGPSSGTQADVYTNAHLGYDGSSYSRNMKIDLSKHVVWNMYDSKGGSYTIELTPGSQLYATDKANGGSVSQIKKSSSDSLQKCYMTTTWTVIGRDKNDCTGWDKDADVSHSSQNLVCSIDKSGTTKVTAGGAYAVWLKAGKYGVGWYSTADKNKIGMYIFNAHQYCRKSGNGNWEDVAGKSWAKWDGCRLYQLKDGHSGERKNTSGSSYIKCE